MEIALNQLPIPDWDIDCPNCHYPLRGLPLHRCPECGTVVDIPALIRPWTRLREPRFTGHELPFPDFGLMCAACGRPLVGAERHACPACGVPFDPAAFLPDRKWFVVDAGLAGPVAVPIIEMLLSQEYVPHVPSEDKTVLVIYGVTAAMGGRVLVPREFFFEVLWLLRRERRRLEEARGAADERTWRCDRCGEENPGDFELCWKCQRPGSGKS